MTQKEYSEPSYLLFEKNEKTKHDYPCYNGWYFIISIDNFLFTLFYAVILNITLNFQFFSMNCCADDASRMHRTLDENDSPRVVQHFFSQKLNMSVSQWPLVLEIPGSTPNKTGKVKFGVRTWFSSCHLKG